MRSLNWMILVAAGSIGVAQNSLATANAMDDDYKFCAIHGFFSAYNQNGFLTNLAAAQRLSTKKGTDTVCNALYKEGASIGERMSRTGKSIKADEEILRAAMDFQLRIQKFVLKGAGY